MYVVSTLRYINLLYSLPCYFRNFITVFGKRYLSSSLIGINRAALSSIIGGGRNLPGVAFRDFALRNAHSPRGVLKYIFT